jgi:hypothetical protein
LPKGLKLFFRSHSPEARGAATLGPVLLETFEFRTFEFRPGAVTRELIGVVDLLRTMNREGALKVPENVPVGFIRRKWGN